MAGGSTSSKVAKRERLASEDACSSYPRGRSASQHNSRQHVICARIAVVVAMLTVTLLVSAVCVMAHQEQSRRMLKENIGGNLVADEDRRSLLTILDFKKLVDKAGSAFMAKKPDGAEQDEVENEAEFRQRWDEQNRKECTIVITKRFRGRCTKSPKGLHLCISAKHMVENQQECESQGEDWPPRGFPSPAQ